MRQRIYIDRQWNFCEEFSEEMIGQPMVQSQLVDIPHTVKELPFHYFDEGMYQMVSCYQKMLKIEEAWKEKEVFLTFEAVGHEADVYINGKHVKNHKCGYTAFQIPLNDYVEFGKENLLTVKVDSRESINQPPFGFVIDYMTYGGIYRDVYLEVMEPMYMEDVFLKPSFLQGPNTSGMNRNQIQELEVEGQLTTEITLSATAQLAPRADISFCQLVNGKVVAQGPLSSEHDIKTVVGKIKLWDIESPVLYEVKTQLLYQGNVVDEHCCTVGFRDAVFKEDGFYLNGRKVLLRGINRHQSYAYVGYAMPASMQRLDAKILKNELALNAVRTSHYPQSHDFMDECDKLGLLVFTEIPGWQHIGDEQWKDIAVENVKEMVMQYRNHTSIILWGVRINESNDDDEFYQRTNEMAHKLDDTRATGGVRCIKNSNLLEDVYTYNDFYHNGTNAGCEPKKKVTSDTSKAYFVSEYNGHMFPTKTFDSEEHRLSHAIRHARVLEDVAKEGDIAGSFGWCMFDYNTHKDFGSGDRICYHGIMDMFRNPKMAADVYSSQGNESVVLSLSSSMDIGEHPACNRGDTYIFSNADSVRMYKNNTFLKEYYPTDSEFKHIPHGPIRIDEFVGPDMVEKEGFTKRQGELVSYCLNSVALNGMKATPKLALAAIQLMGFYHMKWTDAYQLFNKYVGDWGGESKSYRLEAIVDGKVAKTIYKAPMRKMQMSLECSSLQLVEDHTYDVAAIRMQAQDEYGNVLPFFQNSAIAEVDGPIELIGPKVIPFRGGMTGCYVKSTGKSGIGSIKLSCEGMEPVEIKFEVQA